MFSFMTHDLDLDQTNKQGPDRPSQERSKKGINKKHNTNKTQPITQRLKKATTESGKTHNMGLWIHAIWTGQSV